MKIFVTIMHRWGDPDNHTYVLGVFTSEEEAERYGQMEHQYRGNKYDPVVKAFTVNDPKLLEKYKENV